jgi:hypothetical protein
MSTLRFAGTDHKVFTPISTALGTTGASTGTMIVLTHKSVLGGTDFCGVLSSGISDWWHALAQANDDVLTDDEGQSSSFATSAMADDTSNWWWIGMDWPNGTAGNRFHWRNHTTAGSWTHTGGSTSGADRGSNPGTGGWMNIGWMNDNATGTKDIAICAVWIGTRFADGDYGTWTKTSDLYKHALGPPSFLCELTSSTPVDLMGLSTYSSANSTGTTLVGADPPSFTFDQIGPVTIVEQYQSAMKSMPTNKRVYL